MEHKAIGLDEIMLGVSMVRDKDPKTKLCSHVIFRGRVEEAESVR